MTRATELKWIKEGEKLKVGMTVNVVRTFRGEYWDSDLKEYIGQTAIVSIVDKDDGLIKLQHLDGMGYWWSPFSVEPVEKKKRGRPKSTETTVTDKGKLPEGTKCIVTAKEGGFHCFSVGDICEIITSRTSGTHNFRKISDGITQWLNPTQYEVYAEPTTTEKLKVGTKVVITSAATSDFYHCYQVGDVCEAYLIRTSGTHEFRRVSDRVTQSLTSDFYKIYTEPAKPEDTYKALQKKWVELNGLKVGDTVKCTRNWRKGDGGFKYCSVMESFVNREQVVLSLREDAIVLPAGNYFPYFALEKVEKKAFVNVRISGLNVNIKHDAFNAEISADGSAKIGCTSINSRDMKSLVKIFKDLMAHPTVLSNAFLLKTGDKTFNKEEIGGIIRAYEVITK